MTKQKHIKAVDAASNAEDLLPLEQMMSQGSASNEGAAHAVDDINQVNDSAHQGAEDESAALVSKLRFADFAVNSQQSYEPLARVLRQSFSGGTPASNIDAYWNGDIHWASTKDLTSNVLTTTADFITELGLRNSSSKLAKAGSILVGMHIGVGKVAIANIDVAINQDLRALVPDLSRVDLWFLLYVLEANAIRLESYGRGSTVKGITQEDLLQLPVPLLPLPEQQRIGALFKELDHNIELNRGLLEKLTQLKKSMLEQMFPREGESLPRLRFAGFTEPWRKSDLGEISNTITEEAHNHPDLLPIEQTISQVCTTYEVAVRAVDDTHQFKDSEHQGIEGEGSSLLPKLPDGWKWVQLKDLGEIMTGTTPPMLSGRKLQGVLPLITPAEISGSFNGIEAKRWFLQENKAKAKTVPADTVLMVCIGSVGRCSLADREVGFNQQINAVIVDNSVASPAFVLAAFMSPLFKSQLSDKTNCTLIPILNLSTWGDLYVPLPSLAEQQRIGEFFKALDQRITQQRAKVEKLGHLKKALLEQMFV